MEKGPRWDKWVEQAIDKQVEDQVVIATDGSVLDDGRAEVRKYGGNLRAESRSRHLGKGMAACDAEILAIPSTCPGGIRRARDYHDKFHDRGRVADRRGGYSRRQRRYGVRAGACASDGYQVIRESQPTRRQMARPREPWMGWETTFTVAWAREKGSEMWARARNNPSWNRSTEPMAHQGGQESHSDTASSGSVPQL